MKQIKRFVSFLLAICFVASMIPVTARAAESGTCGDNLTWTHSNDGVLTISGTGPMRNYSHDDYEDPEYVDILHACSTAPWSGLFGRPVKSVVIEDGVTSIGDYAFAYCKDVTSLTIPDSVTSIGENAFRNCRELTSVTIPDSVISIGTSQILVPLSITLVNPRLALAY